MAEDPARRQQGGQCPQHRPGIDSAAGGTIAVKFREDRPLAEMRAARVRGEHLAPRPVPRQAAEYFSSVPVGDRTGEVSIQRYGHLAVLPPAPWCVPWG